MNELKFGSKLKQIRKLNGLTLEEVAEKAECTKGFLSQLERDLVAPSVASLKHILDVYDEPLSDFFMDVNTKNKRIFKKSDREKIKITKSYRIERMAPKRKYLEMEPDLYTVHAGETIKQIVEDQEVFGYVATGNIDLRIEKEKMHLESGDCFYLFSGDNFTIKNNAHNDSQIVIVSY